MDSGGHWDRLYATRGDSEVSWFEPEPSHSLSLVDLALASGARSVLDVGGGTSRLVDGLLERGLERIGVLDISATAIARARQRLGDRAKAIEWLVGDVLEVRTGAFDVWHDRALLHFFTHDADRQRYASQVSCTVPPQGWVVLATFGPSGPDRCSGLPVFRSTADDLAALLGPGFALMHSTRATHRTPRGVEQEFVYALFRRGSGRSQAGDFLPADASERER